MPAEFLFQPHTPPFSTAEIRQLSDFGAASRDGIDVLTLQPEPLGRYFTGFAVSPRAIESALRLRYQVFNVELNEGLMASRQTGLDRDTFDDQMVHCVLIDSEINEVVGTYRLQSARDQRPLYSAQEYDLAPLTPLLPQAVECGRACIAKAHRSPQSVLQLWAAIGAYMQMQNAFHLFGCCSLTSIDPDDGWRAMQTLRRYGWLHPEFFLKPMPEYSCGSTELEHDPAIGDAIPLPKLFHAYMRLGAKVISQPAIDRQFGTVDFLVMIDRRQVNMSTLAIQ